MTRTLALALLSVGLSAGLAGGAAAQGFQWPSWLVPRAPQPVPPQPVPGRPPAGQEVPGMLPPDGVPSGPVVPATPPPPKPVAAKVFGEERVLGRDFRLNGSTGLVRINRVGGGDLRARLSLAGQRVSRPGEACTIEQDGLPVASPGRPDGLLRYEIAAPSCPLAVSVLDGGLWVREPNQCVIEAADCRVDPRGIWGPEPGALAPLASVIEQDRGVADRSVRENYKVLSQRASGPEMRAVVSEQAAFSAERETVCRSYRGEAIHGFCNTRYTEARAAQLAARLGLAPPTAAAPPLRRPAATGPSAGAPLPLGAQAQ